ncbi:ATP-grasp domain-containing protein [Flagellimonas beolgyonensis]|uniref:ATP-grasp domain-containing protein n=1 Tax=Flagellimonas beolgyonensis TaxID=864064 RepID=UPI003D6577E8
MAVNILFTCAGRRNYLINYFKDALNGKGKVVAVDSNLMAPALVDADLAIKVPSIYDSNYISALENVIKDHDINAVISLNDLELPILAANRSRLSSPSCKIIISSQEVIEIGFDKWKTHQFIESIGLNSPKTFINFEDAVSALNDGALNFPVVIKPRWGSASIGIDFPENMEELELNYRLLKIRLERTILKKVSQQASNEAILIQEKVDAVEYGMDILNDFDGNYYGTYAREKIGMRAGETDRARSVVDENLLKVGKTIGENLRHIGNLDCDVFYANGQVHVLELNPRFGGGYPFSHEAGVNIAAIYIAWLQGNKKVDFFDNYEAGKIFSKCDRLMEIGRINVPIETIKMRR